MNGRVLFRAAVEPGESQVRHYLGLPTDGVRRLVLPPASSVEIQRSHGQLFLYRFDANRRPAGDTWHATIDDAKAQARSEFGNRIGTWVAVDPDDEP
jgi:hypothetical protein